MPAAPSASSVSGWWGKSATPMATPSIRLMRCAIVNSRRCVMTDAAARRRFPIHEVAAATLNGSPPTLKKGVM